jgi:hypothetical protein
VVRASARLAAVVAVLALAATACSSGSAATPSPSPSQSLSAARSSDAPALLAQCALSRPVTSMLASARRANQGVSATQRWLQGTRLVLTKANTSLFIAWFETNGAGVVIGGMTLDHWAVDAGQHDKLPAAVCGSGVSARQLHNRVYAHFPAQLKNNPWGS